MLCNVGVICMLERTFLFQVTYVVIICKNGRDYGATQPV
jgi:hypothetical protein